MKKINKRLEKRKLIFFKGVGYGFGIVAKVLAVILIVFYALGFLDFNFGLNP